MDADSCDNDDMTEGTTFHKRNSTYEAYKRIVMRNKRSLAVDKSLMNPSSDDGLDTPADEPTSYDVNDVPLSSRAMTEAEESFLVSPGSERSDDNVSGRESGRYTRSNRMRRSTSKAISDSIDESFSENAGGEASFDLPNEKETIVFQDRSFSILLHLIPTQIFTLLWRNVITATRKWQTSVVHLVSPIVLILLITAIDFGVRNNVKDSEKAGGRFKDVKESDPEAIGNIPLCSTSLFINGDDIEGESCKTLVYTPQSQVDVDDVIRGIASQNDPPIPEEQLLSLPSQEEVNSYMIENPRRVLAAIHFNLSFESLTESPLTMTYTLQTNSTIMWFKGKYQDPNKYVQLPLQIAAEREIVKKLMSNGSSLGNNNLITSSINTPGPQDWRVSLSSFPHPPVSYIPSIAGMISPTFILAAAMIGFVIQLAEIVDEKHSMMRTTLRHAGLQDISLWTSWSLWFGSWSCLIAGCIVGITVAVQLALVIRNSTILFFSLILCFLLAMSSLVLLFSVFISNPASAVTAGFVVFLIGWVIQLVVVFGFPYDSRYTNTAQIIFSVMPWALMAKALQDLDAAASSDSSLETITWNRRYSYCTENVDDTHQDKFFSLNCSMSVGTVIDILAVFIAACTLLAIYLEASFRFKNPFFFCLGPYWGWTSRNRQSSLKDLQTKANFMSADDSITDDGAATEAMNLQDALEMYSMGTVSIEQLPRMAALGVTKSYPQENFLSASKRILSNIQSILCSCCTRRTDGKHWANPNVMRVLEGVWLSFPSNQVTCLLGPNGSGKTTLVSILSGDIASTTGRSILSGLDPSLVRSRIGICPQFDALADHMTATEHLILYANMRGIPRKIAKKKCAELLQKMDLHVNSTSFKGRHKTVSTFSGGMKRRLSVALALLGDPVVVIFDEPSSGIDPASKRKVWEAIHEAKIGRSVMITTHSMEEAEVLGDRVAILVRGKVRALGTPLSLKTRWLEFRFVLFITIAQPHTMMLPDWRLEKMLNDISSIVRKHIGSHILDAGDGEQNECSEDTTFDTSPHSQASSVSLSGEEDSPKTNLSRDNNPLNADHGDSVTFNVNESENGSNHELDDQMDASAGEEINAAMRKLLFNQSAHHSSKLSYADYVQSRKSTLHSKQSKSFLIRGSAAPLLADMFDELEEGRKELGISGIQLTSSTLEEVFLNVVYETEFAVARAEGSLETVVIDGRAVKVPTGARMVAIPPLTNNLENTLATEGFEVWNLRWMQDDHGRLQMISAHPVGCKISPKSMSEQNCDSQNI